jgi:hypothetical protein
VQNFESTGADLRRGELMKLDRAKQFLRYAQRGGRFSAKLAENTWTGQRRQCGALSKHGRSRMQRRRGPTS